MVGDAPSPIRHVPTVPYDPAIPRYNAFGGYFEPFEFTGWVDESMSWKQTCYIGDWSPMSKLRLVGPDALRFFSETTVNSYAAFAVGQAKHAIFCNANGNIMGEGILVREAEDSIYLTSGFAVPWCQYLLEQGEYDVVATDITTQMTLQQVQGPNSLAVLEEATGESMRDIPFMHLRAASIDGTSVHILRQGMSGDLGFEVHGRWEEGAAVYARIVEVGEKYGIRKLGGRAKMMNHLEACFPTPTVDFVPAWFDRGVEGFLAWVQNRSWRPVDVFKKHSGSVVTDANATELFRTPVDLGWARNVKFDHTFIGDHALRPLVASPRRTIRTLVWHRADVADVIESLFDPHDEPYKPFEFPRGYLGDVVADRVLVGDDEVGHATSRGYSYYFREMISLAVLDQEHAEIGTRVEVVWGDVGRRQKRIRATVARAPFKTDRRRSGVPATP
jgi:vanillate/3-O-methylgallate O-demethylase